jgi:cytochrome b561
LPADFLIYPSWIAHIALAALLVGIIALHVLAALYRQFIRRDRLFRRMLFGWRLANSARADE